MSDSHHSPVQPLNGLLRGMLAASASYRGACGELSGLPVVEMLHAHREELDAGIAGLRAHIRQLGGEPDEGGILSGIARLVEETAAKLSEEAALSVLLCEERHLLGEVGKLAEEPDLPAPVRTWLGDHLAPDFQRRIVALETAKDPDQAPQSQSSV